MPKFDLAPDAVDDIVAFLYREIATAAEWQTYQKPSVPADDARAGEAFFNGPVGRCNTCHSTEGDLKGFAARNNNDAPSNQQLIIDERPCGPRARGGPPPDLKKFVPTATVTTNSGEVFTGLSFQISDFLMKRSLVSALLLLGGCSLFGKKPTNRAETWTVDGKQFILIAGGDTLYAFTLSDPQ